jgi:hypothetical protein
VSHCPTVPPAQPKRAGSASASNIQNKYSPNRFEYFYNEDLIVGYWGKGLLRLVPETSSKEKATMNGMLQPGTEPGTLCSRFL